MPNNPEKWGLQIVRESENDFPANIPEDEKVLYSINNWIGLESYQSAYELMLKLLHNKSSEQVVEDAINDEEMWKNLKSFNDKAAATESAAAAQQRKAVLDGERAAKDSAMVGAYLAALDSSLGYGQHTIDVKREPSLFNYDPFGIANSANVPVNYSVYVIKMAELVSKAIESVNGKDKEQ
jgi:hypothetical protein